MKTTAEQRAELRRVLAAAGNAAYYVDGYETVKAAVHASVAAIPALLDDLDDLDAALALLRRLEWIEEQAHGIVVRKCVCCGRWKNEGHAADCELAALLKAADAPAPTEDASNDMGK